MNGTDIQARSRVQAILGHYWTLAPRIAHGLRPERAPEAGPWTYLVQDARAGSVRLTGLYRNLGAGTPLLVVVHGLGGTASSYYACRAARAAEAAGLSCLRLNLRGAARDGEDFYHAGLVEDLEAALASPETRDHPDIYVLGYSLGGHLALRYGCLRPDPRVRALAAVSAPLDLSACADWIDRPGALIYQRYLLRSLFEMYDRTASRRPHLLPPDGVRNIRSIRAFDEAVVAPRHGFAGAADYYERASAGPLLHRLARPALLLLSPYDPMVPAGSAVPWLIKASPLLTVRWTARGGHVGMPSGLRIGEGAEPGAENQIVGWFRRQGRKGAQTAAAYPGHG